MSETGAIPKPGHVFDRDWEWEGLTDFVTSPSPDVILGVVSGRRRQGKTFLLDALAQANGGFFFTAPEGADAELRRSFGDALGSYATGTSEAAIRLDTWVDAIRALFDVVPEGLIVLDEFPFMVRANPTVTSLIQRELGPRGAARRGGQTRLLLCGSAMSVMGKLLAGQAPLRGRASLELVVQPFGYREAARFWGIDDPRLAILVHAVVGGTPAYRREFAGNDAPGGLDDFDAWVTRTVLDPRRPLFREARYLLGEEPDVRDPALYQTVLAAIATGNVTNGAIANYLERKSADVVHPLNVLEDCGLVIKDPDAFRPRRYTYRITEPLITFYEAVMRKSWTQLSRRDIEGAWAGARSRFLSQVVGPHFEDLCREFVLDASVDLFGEPPSDVLAGTVPDPARRTQIEVDVAALAPSEPGERRRVLSLGEAKWGEVMGMRHLERLRRARDLLRKRGHEVDNAVLACYSGAGFDAELREAARRGEVMLVDPGRLYAD